MTWTLILWLYAGQAGEIRGMYYERREVHGFTSRRECDEAAGEVLQQKPQSDVLCLRTPKGEK